MAHARIRSITFKDGRAPIRVLSTERRKDLDENWRGVLIDHARKIADDLDDISGFVIMAVQKDGAFSWGCRIDKKTCPIPLTLWPAYLEEVARRRLIVDETVRMELAGEWDRV